MTAKKSGQYSPTKGEIWQELCDTREQLIEILKENHKLIAQNTVATNKSNDLLASMQKSIDLLNDRLQKEIGVPPKIFVLVVAVLLLVLLSVMGITAADLVPLIQ